MGQLNKTGSFYATVLHVLVANYPANSLICIKSCSIMHNEIYEMTVKVCTYEQKLSKSIMSQILSEGIPDEPL